MCCLYDSQHFGSNCSRTWGLCPSRCVFAHFAVFDVFVVLSTQVLVDVRKVRQTLLFHANLAQDVLFVVSTTWVCVPWKKLCCVGDSQHFGLKLQQDL